MITSQLQHFSDDLIAWLQEEGDKMREILDLWDPQSRSAALAEAIQLYLVRIEKKIDDLLIQIRRRPND